MQAWNKTLSTSQDTVFAAGDYSDQRSGVTLAIVASGPFWVDGTAINTSGNPGDPGHSSLMPANSYTFTLTDQESIHFLGASAGVTLQGFITST